MNIELRPIESEDTERIAKLVNDKDIAKNTARLPYPYTITDAKTWVEYTANTENEHVFAIAHKKCMMGAIGIVHEPEHKRAEIGYWLGKEYWNRGIATSAVEIMLGYAFGVLKVNKVYANVFSANPASQTVLEKNGFVLEGCLKQHYMRMGTMQDLLYFGLLKEDYNT